MKQTLIGLGLCALLAWGIWRQPPSSPGVQHREFFAMGTLMQISFADPVPAGLMNRIQTELRAFEQRWSPRGDGELAQLNRQLTQHAQAPLPPVLRPGFVASQQACRSSDGLFDPGMGALVKLWGFDDESHFRTTPPEPETIALALAQRGKLCRAELDAKLSVDVPGAYFDFGASAKGRAIDAIVALLRNNGVHNAIVNAGGDLKAIGQRADRLWRIGIRHPRPQDAQDILASLSVKDGEAVFSSGDYERFFISEGTRYHHIIDPRDGYPATTSQSATVVHTSAELADAAATALFVAGPQRAAEIMGRMGITHYLLVDAQGDTHTSPEMRARLDGLP